MYRDVNDHILEPDIDGALDTAPTYRTENPLYQCNCWPDADQYLLLKTILTRSDEDALGHWEKFCRAVDIQQLPFATTSLLPLAYHRLRKLSSHDVLEQTGAELATAKSIYRHTWSRNQLDLHALRALLDTLKQEEIEVTLLKGAAMITNYYRDPGLRVIGDFDLLVDRKDVLKVSEILTQAGWGSKLAPLQLAQQTPHSKTQQPSKEIIDKDDSDQRVTDLCIPPRDQPITQEMLHLGHAHCFINSSGLCIDLHWRVFGEAPRDRWLETFRFETASVYERDPNDRKTQGLAAVGLNTNVLCPEDQLIHTLVHGVRQSPGCSFVRWIPDSVWIIEGPEGLRWDYVIRQAKELRLTYLLKITLGYLQRQGFIQLPNDVITQIASLEHSVADQRWIECLMQDHNDFLFPYRYTWRRYVRSYPERGKIAKLLGLGAYLKESYGLPNHLALYRLVMTKGLKGFKRRFSERFM